MLEAALNKFDCLASGLYYNCDNFCLLVIFMMGAI